MQNIVVIAKSLLDVNHDPSCASWGWHSKTRCPTPKPCGSTEQLSQAGLMDALFEDFDAYLKSQGFQARGGQIIDASLVAVPIQRNSRADKEQIKRGETPDA